MAEEQARLGISPILDSMCLCPVSPGSSHSSLFLTPGQCFSKCVSWFKTKEIGQRMSVECLPNVHEALGLIPQHCINQTWWKNVSRIGSWAYLLCETQHGLGELLGNRPWELTCGRELFPHVAELGSGGNQPTAGTGSAVGVGLRTRCWVAGFS